MIRLQFSHGAGMGAELIEWFSAGDYSHVDIMADEGLIGARLDGGVQCRPYNYQDWTRLALVSLAVPAPVEAMFYHLADSQIGKPYDRTAIIGFAAGRDWRETDSWFCSELVAWCLEKAGAFKADLVAPCNKITPSALLLVVSSWAKPMILRDGTP